MFALAILLIIVITILVYHHFSNSKVNKYVIKNSHYGFEIETPKDWIAEENSFYSEKNIDELVSRCKNNISSSSSYQIAAFRFKDQEYPHDFGYSGFFPEGSPTGAILEVSINCISDRAGYKIENYGYDDLIIGGVKSSQRFLDLSGFGKTKYLSFFHNDTWYKISQYVYINGAEKNEASIRDSYSKVFDDIISSFEFID